MLFSFLFDFVMGVKAPLSLTLDNNSDKVDFLFFHLKCQLSPFPRDPSLQHRRSALMNLSKIFISSCLTSLAG
jgi:hypothetical protein